ncbi:hypothetical protein PAND9192_02426 [Photobacterium andalusiense]|uniref:Uncharacterized protein n=1 Tax=Photobacterium andalusiense TaxID=2204296 RepID=A0A1Y6MHJ5_9GAMM|nr:hypothetical protein PAND9192_02426 [Photobacterium andalusiense]
MLMIVAIFMDVDKMPNDKIDATSNDNQASAEKININLLLIMNNYKNL